jgi:hypothetical protein
VKSQKPAPHLPLPPVDQSSYDDLYASEFRIDGISPGMPEDWKEIRISAGATEFETYRHLPSAPDFEYGGYLTKTRIRFQPCEATQAFTNTSKACTFHSHPTDYSTSDIPSDKDIYSFLKWRHLRAITVGRDWIWVWDKDQYLLSVVKRLLHWEKKHMVEEMGRLCKSHPDDFIDRCIRKALDAIGIEYPKKKKPCPEEWSKALESSIGLKTRLISRDNSRKS